MDTAEMIERQAERAMDRLDARLMRGELMQSDYDAAVRQLDRLVQDAYEHSSTASA